MKPFSFLFAFVCCVSVHAQVSFKMDNTESTISSTEKDTIVVKGDTLTEDIYTTMAIIDYKYSVKLMKPKQDALDRLMSELNSNASGENPAPVFPPLVLAQKKDSVRMLTNDINDMKKDQDSLYFAYTKDYVNYRRITFLPGPMRSCAFFDLMYGNDGQRFKAIGNTGVNFGNNTASIYSEIVSGNLGLLRVGLGTMVTSNNNPDDSTGQQQEAYQRLVTSGGNTVLSMEYPLLYMHTMNDQLNLISRPMLKGTADIPLFGTSTDEWAGSFMYGLDLYADAALDNNSLRFFMNGSIFQIYGTSVYQSNLGISSKQFYFGQLTLGLVFLENYKISFIVGTLSSEATLENRKVIIGGQVLR